MQRFLYSLLIYTASLLTAANVLAKDSCALVNKSETVQVRYIHDGDTLFLTDGRKLRLIGLNTPELEQEGQTSEPLAIQARNHLRKLLQQSKNTLLIEYDQASKDKYGRTLAHAFLTNGQNITQILITQGYATSLIVPPNLQHWQCYQQAEKQARTHNTGIWALDSYQTQTVEQLPEKANGFFIVRGTVRNIQHYKKSAMIQLEQKLELFIHADDMVYFTDTLKTIKTGQSLKASGWIHPRKTRLLMRIRHPSVIEYTTPQN